MKISKQIIGIFLLLISINLTAQKIKVKKQKVTFDKVPVAKYEKESSNVSILSSLSHENSITVEIKSLNITKDLKKTWLVVTDKDKKRVSQIEMKYLIMTFSVKRGIAVLLAKKYKIITKNGIENLDSFFKENTSNLEEEYNKLINGVVKEQTKLYNLNISVNEKSRQVFKGTPTEENLIGNYSLNNMESVANPGIVTFYDLDNHKVGIATLGPFKTSIILPYKKISFEFTPDKSYSSNSPSSTRDFIKELVQQLFLNETALGHQISQAGEAKQQAVDEIKQNKIEKWKKTSKNIYWTKGYLMDRKKGKREGEIEFVVERLNNAPTSNLQASFNLRPFGRTVFLKYIKKNGRSRNHIAKSKKEETFCIYTDGNTERCFKGMNAKEIGSFYFEILKENNKIGIYKDIAHNGDLLVKLNSQEKAIQFNLKDSQKNIEELNTYFNGSIAKKDLINLDFSKKEDALKLLEL